MTKTLAAKMSLILKLVWGFTPMKESPSGVILTPETPVVFRSNYLPLLTCQVVMCKVTFLVRYVRMTEVIYRRFEKGPCVVERAGHAQQEVSTENKVFDLIF
tara:strand:+ start:533 stop:838 length:306 start_codon:yes stop_codon:yes gene_type:complete